VSSPNSISKNGAFESVKKNPKLFNLYPFIGDFTYIVSPSIKVSNLVFSVITSEIAFATFLLVPKLEKDLLFVLAFNIVLSA